MTTGSGLLHLVLLAISVAISAGVAAACWRHRHEVGAAGYALVALSQASWTFGYMLEVAHPALGDKIQWDNFQFVGMAGWAAGLIAFTLTFTGRPARRAWLTAGLASLPFVVVVVLAYTDPWHHLIRQRMRLVPGQPFPMLLYDLTGPVWACAVYAFGCLALLNGMLAVKHLRAHRIYRRQVGIVLAGNIVNIVGAFATLTVLRDRPGRDLTPLTFAVSNVLVAWGLLRFRLFDVVPIARDAVIEAIDDAMFVLDPQDRVVDLNPAARRLLDGRAAGSIGRPAADIVPGWPVLLRQRRPPSADPAGAPGAKRVPDRAAGRVRPDPELLRLEITEAGSHFAELSCYALPDLHGGVDGRVVLWRDITTRKRMENELRLHQDHLEQLVEVRTAELHEQTVERERIQQQLRQAQKMEAVGRMAGGIAHDFNNLLQVLNLNLEGLAARLPEVARSEEYADVRLELERAAQLIRHLLLFSRRQPLEPRVLDLNAVIERGLTLIRRAVGSGVRLETSLDPDLWSVCADPVQLEQVLLNLAINARDAMPDGGTLALRTRRVTVADGGTISPRLNPGEYVALDVADTGHGMDAETQAQIFDPFFTTKEPGKGTGLGLSTAYGIITQSRGSIGVVSAPATGTTFTIHLPRTEAAATSAETDRMPAPGARGA
jgi:signal transduction histidine kinase